RAGQDAGHRRAGVHGRGQPLAPARLRAHRASLVLDPEHLFPVAGSARYRPHRADGLALARGAARGAAVPGVDRAVPARLSRAGDLDLPVSRAAHADDLADRRGAREPDFHAAGDAGAAAGRSRLYHVRLLALPRQGARRRRLSLNLRRARRSGAARIFFALGAILTRHQGASRPGMRPRFLAFAYVLIGKPAPTFRGHTLTTDGEF